MLIFATLFSIAFLMGFGTLTIGALRTGKLKGIGWSVLRTQSPYRFWFGVGCYSICILFALCFTIGLSFAALLDIGAERTVFQRAESPDGRHEARVQFDDAGALSGFSRLVLIKGSWNFSDEPLLSCRAFWADGERQVHLRWLNANTLLIEHGFDNRDVRGTSGSCGSVRIVIKGSDKT